MRAGSDVLSPLPGSHCCGSFENVLAPGDQRRFLMRSTPAKPFGQRGPSSGREAAGAPREHAAGAGTATQPQGWKHRERG